MSHSQGSIQVNAEVVLERNGQTVEAIETGMINDVNETVGSLITGGPEDGLTFNQTYSVINPPLPPQTTSTPSISTSTTTPKMGK